MAPPKLRKRTSTAAAAKTTSELYPAISTVAAAQICLNIGFAAGDPAALRSLSRLAALYLQTLARSASSIAGSNGRSESNLLDVIRAIEDLSLGRGFPGAADPARPLLRSSVVKDLVAFVGSVEEVPFPKQMPKREREVGVGIRVRPPERGAHIPRWLPGFPVGWRGEERKRDREEEKLRWEERIELGLGFVDSEDSGVRPLLKPCALNFLPGERRVRFRLGSGLSKGEKRGTQVLLHDDDDDDDDYNDKNGGKSCLKDMKMVRCDKVVAGTRV